MFCTLGVLDKLFSIPSEQRFSSALSSVKLVILLSMWGMLNYLASTISYGFRKACSFIPCHAVNQFPKPKPGCPGLSGCSSPLWYPPAHWAGGALCILVAITALSCYHVDLTSRALGEVIISSSLASSSFSIQVYLQRDSLLSYISQNVFPKFLVRFSYHFYWYSIEFIHLFGRKQISLKYDINPTEIMNCYPIYSALLKCPSKELNFIFHRGLRHSLSSFLDVVFSPIVNHFFLLSFFC